MIQILIVEDDRKLNTLYKTVLDLEDFTTHCAYNGNEALEILDQGHIDMIITDIMMPEMDGYELVDMLRSSGFNQPVLMITAKDQFEDIEKGYDLGIDDYMVKPINVNEMVLRVKAILKRIELHTDRKINLGSAIIDKDAMTLSINNTESLVPQKEFQLLLKLLSHPNKIFTRQQLMDEVWGYDVQSDERTVDVHINRLRRRFKTVDDVEIVTVRGLGYKVVVK